MRSRVLRHPRPQRVVGMCECPPQQRNRCRCRMPTSSRATVAGPAGTRLRRRRDVRARGELPFLHSTPERGSYAERSPLTPATGPRSEIRAASGRAGWILRSSPKREHVPCQPGAEEGLEAGTLASTAELALILRCVSESNRIAPLAQCLHCSRWQRRYGRSR
jgi:hypothetical protein